MPSYQELNYPKLVMSDAKAELKSPTALASAMCWVEKSLYQSVFDQEYKIIICQAYKANYNQAFCMCSWHIKRLDVCGLYHLALAIFDPFLLHGGNVRNQPVPIETTLRRTGLWCKIV